MASRGFDGWRRGRRPSAPTLGRRDLVERLQARGVEQLADQDEVWAIVDPSELRKPYAREMPDLMRVRRLGGEGTVPGYRTLNVLGVGREGQAGHPLPSALHEPGGRLPQRVPGDPGRAGLGWPSSGRASWSGHLHRDSQFDDMAVWGTIWEQGNHLVCRLEAPGAAGGAGSGANCHEVGRPGRRALAEALSVEAAKARVREVARVRTEMLVRKRGQRYKKRQPVTAVVSSLPDSGALPGRRAHAQGRSDPSEERLAGGGQAGERRS